MGPQAWKRAIYSDLPHEQPLLAEEIIVPLGRPVPDLNLVKVHLINGGRHFILGSNAALEIWDVIAKRCVWSRDGSGRTVSVGRAIEEHTLTMTILNGYVPSTNVYMVKAEHGTARHWRSCALMHRIGISTKPSYSHAQIGWGSSRPLSETLWLST